ncbi:MAG: alpha/beta fold hydrolase [Meiothermus sp.]|uniref:alpha/beta hydrolase n=1 Tax=Meiothermus sp. TaxID=1955249 RepID=UPI0025DD7F34|nr:alpha/beta fold hydrolase [Meiothermus sp.]MCS7057882.1 alpha/beta fold hydrolase [Meiothermus sp.]MCS7194242.1 alpha/beta fold hydrolase [Meiothermus sp.]MCX7740468.1 alpha/beta fold hydrolase [Meiothermus sp.]MDW8090824.1 alpha/beta fold hydrolase [Meiothermus sp.]MDW8480754.1 alpha/beta fold hydrolase [Meiothermus sp.]
MNVLVLHGFTSHPIRTMGPLPDTLRRAGFNVAQPALPGHGTRPEDLRHVRWQDWLQTAREAYLALPEPRAVVGLSMGGLLAGWLAAEHETAALVALAPALGLKNRLAYLAPLLHPFKPWAYSTDPAQVAARQAKSPNYPNFPTVALTQLIALQRRLPGLLPRVRASALVLEAAQDDTVPPTAVRRYFSLLGSPHKEYRTYPSQHDMLLDPLAQQVSQEIAVWLRERLASA